MNKKVLYMGAPISIPHTLSGIQDNVENYFDTMTRSLVRTSGIVRSQTHYYQNTPPCFLYIDNGQLRISEGTLCFLGPEHALLYEISNTVIEDDLVWMRNSEVGGNLSFFVYAVQQPIADGLLLRRAQGFVYDINESVASFYDEQIDNVTFEITTEYRGQGENINDPNQILIGTIYNYFSENQAEVYGFNYYGEFTINQLTGAEYMETALPGKFADEYLILNSTQEGLVGEEASAGLKICLGEDVTADFLITTSVSGYRWQTNYPIAAADPVYDQDLVTKGWLDNYLDELLFEVPDVINFKITDIRSIRSMQPTMPAPTPSYSVGLYHKFKVLFNWGYTNITGTGTSNTNEFTVSTSGISFTSHSLTGYCLWLPAYNGGTNLKISDNTGNLLYLTEIDGTPFTFASSHTISLNADFSTLGWIHMNAHSYEIEAVPYVNSALDYSKSIISRQSQTYFKRGPVRLGQEVDLDYGIVYKIQIRGVRTSYSGEWTQLTAGSFNKYFPGANTTESISYSHPYLVQYPNIPFVYGANGDDTALTLATSINGFTLKLAQTAWPDAEEYEISWSSDDEKVDPDFNKNFQSSKSTGRIFSVTNTRIGMYYVRLRPLIAGTQVCENGAILEGNIYAGYSDYHNGQILAQGNFNLKTYEGVMICAGTVVDELPILWNFSSLHTPAYYASGVQQLSVTSPPYDIEGKIMTVEEGQDVYSDWMIDTFDKDSFVLRELGGGADSYFRATLGDSYPVTMGTSERARRVLYVTNVPFNYEIVGIDVDVKVIRNGPVHLRVYQEGHTTSFTGTYDNMTIPANSTGQAVTSNGIDVLINSGGNIIVDLYDPEGGDVGLMNANGLQGYITIYAIPYTGKKGYVKDV